MDIEKKLKELNLEEKAALLAGGATFASRGLPKHDIPSFLLSDGPHGLRKQAGAADHLGIAGSEPATCFPTAATMANSWDEALGEEVGVALGEEAVGQGVSVLLGPGLNMKRDPLCGRNFEYFSEDPYLAGKMAASYVRGIQSQGGSACPKHFAVNSQETRRMASDSQLDERTLREIYLTGFEIVVRESKPRTIMTSYNLVNDTYASESKYLLKDILREEWGFDGMVVTDWGGSNDHALGVKNGSTLEMPAPGLGSAREVIAAVKSGKISEADVDDRIRELLTLINRTQPAIDRKPKYSEEQHHILARKAAGECVVLLKNDEKILPLAGGTKVALIGDFAETPRYQGAGSSVVNSTKVDSLKALIGDSSLNCIGYAQGFDRIGTENAALQAEAVALSKNADVVLLCMGLNESNESEGAERLSMKVEQNQIDLLKAIQAVNKQIVVLFFSGSTVEVPWIDNAKGFVYAGLGGQAGAGALLDVITGKINPSGKLTETWPISYEDTPAQIFPSQIKTSEYREGPYIGYRYYDTAGIPVRFPFGYGLSYTTFEYSNLHINGDQVSFTVTNTGAVAGAEVAQLYVSLPDSSIYRAKKELKGFKRVELASGASKTVTITLDDKAFRYWNVRMKSWEEEGGKYEILIGANVEDIKLKGTIEREGTHASAPYEGSMGVYETAQIKDVPDEDFRKLLGRELPEKGKTKIDKNMTFGDLNHGRSPLFLLVWFILNQIKVGNEKKGKADLNILFIYNMPLRALAKMAGGMVDMNMVNGIVLEVKGFWIIGLLWVIVAFIINMIKNAIGEAKLK
ncbi:MAG: glycoside hydrolase family 3 C-terminal domain-containing protein [Lachnospiraceae bacterium]|nr:glycoside hydrolase family 3 C-terminal domain-containing protein [Lachnospiraceae bacterium]